MNEIKNVKLNVTVEMADGSLLKRSILPNDGSSMMNLMFDEDKCNEFASDKIIYDNIIVEAIHHASIMFDRLAAKYNPKVAYSDNQILIKNIKMSMDYQAENTDGKLNTFETIEKEIKDKKSNVSFIMTFTIECNKIVNEMKMAISSVRKKVE